MISATGHFAKQFAGPELRERTIDRKIDIRIDADELSLVRFRAMIGLIAAGLLSRRTGQTPRATL